jgi:hypothetical protein
MWRRVVGVLVSLVVAVAGIVAVESPANAASAPTTSPVAASRTFQTTWNPDCPSDYACAWVPYGNGRYLFKFYRYGTYYLSNWFGEEGYAANNQTGGAAMRLYDSRNVQVQCIPGGFGEAFVDWNPVWSIRLTATPC